MEGRRPVAALSELRLAPFTRDFYSTWLFAGQAHASSKHTSATAQHCEGRLLWPLRPATVLLPGRAPLPARRGGPPTKIPSCSCFARACRTSFQSRKIAIEPVKRFGRSDTRKLHPVDVAASRTPQGPALEPCLGRSDPLHPGRTSATLATGKRQHRSRRGDGFNGQILYLPSCQNLVRALKIAPEPSQGVGVFHRVDRHQFCRDASTPDALEGAQIVTRWCRRDAFQHHAGLAMRTARALDGAERKSGRR